MKAKIIGLVVALVVVAALAATAAGLTGAYFSDTKTGGATGSIGDIHVTTSGGTGADGMTFSWSGMFPGAVYSAPITVTNTSSSSAEDLWISFPNLTALSALNQLGTYGAVTITVNDVPVFQSNHLNDNVARGNSVGNGGGLPPQWLLASNVAHGAVTNVVFKFEYASKMTQPEPGAVFNLYPIPAIVGNRCLNGDAYLDTTGHIQVEPLAAGGTDQSLYPYMTGPGAASDGSGNTYYAQVTVNPADTGTSGLPFQIIATQPGILPTDKGTAAPIIP